MNENVGSAVSFKCMSREVSLRKTVCGQTVICGDCVEMMRTMEDESFDVVCTSPPYNIDARYRRYKDKKPRDEYIDWLLQVVVEIKRLLKADGSLFLVMAGKCSDPALPFDALSPIKRLMKLQNHIIWVKSIAIGDDPRLSFGHYKPVNSNRFEHNCFENVFHLTKTGKVACDKLAIGLPYKWKCNRKNRKTKELGPDLRPRGNTWYVRYDTIQHKSERFYHPSPFPPKLVEMCIRFHGLKKKPTVLDPFLGIGNTLLACDKLGLEGVGVDMDEAYCKNVVTLLEAKNGRT